MDICLQFCIPGVPKPKLRPRFSKWGGHGRVYDPNKKVSKIISRQFIAQMKEPIIDKPIRVHMNFVMPIPKSTSKKKRELMLSGVIKYTKTPDIDNTCKEYMDCMNAIVYLDDKQIYKLSANQEYGEIPKTEITIWYDPAYPW